MLAPVRYRKDVDASGPHVRREGMTAASTPGVAPSTTR
jgi:hypothetical protein